MGRNSNGHCCTEWTGKDFSLDGQNGQAPHYSLEHIFLSFIFKDLQWGHDKVILAACMFCRMPEKNGVTCHVKEGFGTLCRMEEDF